MIQPPALKAGDTVALIATARKTSRQELEPAVALLREQGLDPLFGDSIGLENHQFAGTDKERARDLEKQLHNPEVKAIWCVKGGYGTVRILEHLDYTAIQKHPKWLIGYSDVSVLHSLYAKLNLCSIHGQMATAVETRSRASRQSLFSALHGKHPEYEWKSHHLNKPGTAKGTLIGGNLSVLYSLCGSPEEISTRGKILFIEDLDEYLYHIDRMMQNLKRGGIFDAVKAVIVGGMTDMNDNTVPFGANAEEIVAETLGDVDMPVSFNFPAGHQEDNRALVFGKNVELTVASAQSQMT